MKKNKEWLSVYNSQILSNLLLKSGHMHLWVYHLLLLSQMTCTMIQLIEFIFPIDIFNILVFKRRIYECFMAMDQSKKFFSFVCRTHTHMVYLSLNSFIQLFLPGFPAAKLMCSYIYLLCMYTIIKFLTKSAIIFFLPFFNSKFSSPCRNKHWSKCSLNTYV